MTVDTLAEAMAAAQPLAVELGRALDPTTAGIDDRLIVIGFNDRLADDAVVVIDRATGQAQITSVMVHGDRFRAMRRL